MNILDKIEFLMQRQGIKNRAELSELSGIPYSTITNFYAKGYDKMKLSTLKALASCLGVTIDYLGRDEITDPNYGFSIPAPSSDLTPDEKKLLEDYRSLNDQGREHIRTCMASAQALFKEKPFGISNLESKSS